MKKAFEVCKIEPDKDAEIIDTPIAKFWIDKERMMYSSPYRIKRTYDNIRESLALIKARVGLRKFCLLSDNTEMVEIPREARKLIVKELETFVKAHALISCSPMGSMLSHIVFKMNKPKYPIRIFKNIEDAKKWLKQF